MPELHMASHVRVDAAVKLRNIFVIVKQVSEASKQPILGRLEIQCASLFSNLPSHQCCGYAN